jgi:hypothetical protein
MARHLQDSARAISTAVEVCKAAAQTRTSLHEDRANRVALKTQSDDAHARLVDGARRQITESLDLLQRTRAQLSRQPN